MAKKRFLGFNPELIKFIEDLNVVNISTERKATLNKLKHEVSLGTHRNILNLIFICTHNSRRSQLAQIWAQTMSAFFGIDNVICYSAGTENTCIYPTIIEVLKLSGFLINKLSNDKNPIYSIKYTSIIHPIIGFSKTLESSFNPERDFLAITTCSDIEKNCPYISGAQRTISLTYADPKLYDHSADELNKYMERNIQVATEMKYVFSHLNDTA